MHRKVSSRFMSLLVLSTVSLLWMISLISPLHAYAAYPYSLSGYDKSGNLTAVKNGTISQDIPKVQVTISQLNPSITYYLCVDEIADNCSKFDKHSDQLVFDICAADASHVKKISQPNDNCKSGDYFHDGDYTVGLFNNSIPDKSKLDFHQVDYSQASATIKLHVASAHLPQHKYDPDLNSLQPRKPLKVIMSNDQLNGNASSENDYQITIRSEDGSYNNSLCLTIDKPNTDYSRTFGTNSNSDDKAFKANTKYYVTFKEQINDTAPSLDIAGHTIISLNGSCDGGARIYAQKSDTPNGVDDVFTLGADGNNTVSNASSSASDRYNPDISPAPDLTFEYPPSQQCTFDEKADAGSQSPGAYVCHTAIGDIVTSPQEFIKKIFSILLGIGGGIAVIIIIAAGFRFMTSRGDEKVIQEAREAMTSAIIGLVFIIFSLVVLQIIGVDILHLPGLKK